MGSGFCNTPLLPQRESWVSQKQRTTPERSTFHSRLLRSEGLCEYVNLSSYTCSPPLSFICSLHRELRWCRQTASWDEEQRIDVLHFSFLSVKGEDEKILPEMNGVIHTSQYCYFKLHLCLKPYSSPSCILTQLRTSELWQRGHFTPFWKVFCLKDNFSYGLYNPYAYLTALKSGMVTAGS